MVDRQQIIHMYRTRGLSKQAIGRALDINRKTVMNGNSLFGSLIVW